MISKRMLTAVAAGVVAGATVVGVPTFAYAANDSSDDTNGSGMGSMMSAPALVESMKNVMSEVMSDPQLQEQMRSIMGAMGNMTGMSGTGGSGDGSGNP